MGSNLPIHPQAFSMLAAMLGWEGCGCLLGGLWLCSPCLLLQYSPSMRATYLSVTDEHLRPQHTEFPA